MTDNEFSQRMVSMMDTLYRVSYSQLSRACDRDDAVAECLYKAWKKRRQLRDERYMQTWVVRILINECHNLQRDRAREIPSDMTRAAPPDAEPMLHDALLRLDETLRLPIILHYMEGFAIDEIAQILRLPPGTVKSRMHRGRGQLAAWLALED